jgi:hypothetical protein
MEKIHAKSAENIFLSLCGSLRLLAFSAVSIFGFLGMPRIK